jgi:hypothetical protein
MSKIFDNIHKNSNWFHRQLVKFWVMKWELSWLIMDFKNKDPKFKAGCNHVAQQIADDIEFGYTSDMIYEKIKLGQYDNTI